MDGAPVLETSELAYVLVRLEQAVEETAAGFRRGLGMVVGLFVLMGLAMIAQGSWPIALHARKRRAAATGGNGGSRTGRTPRDARAAKVAADDPNRDSP